ncbi:hypothetical protein PSCICL_40000 [Pseudomonas cichorii]|nr:hypothetical protein PSCICL_40000 [Pseudomonas cichorii]
MRMRRHLPSTGEEQELCTCSSHPGGIEELISRNKSCRQARVVKGDVRVTCVQDVRMGRATNLAEVTTGTGMQSPPLPPLHDARLSGMATLGFVFSGFEVIDDCAYAQPWWCRLE